MSISLKAQAPSADATGMSISSLERRGNGQAGSVLIEVLVGASVLLALAIGIFAGLDGAAKTSGANRSRSVAADLAEQDQERLRSKRVSSLSGLNETRNVVVAGITYRVDSVTHWRRDATQGDVNCTSTGAQAGYLEITSTVTANGRTLTKPVVVSSTVAPPAGAIDPTLGTLTVQVNDRNGIGAPGHDINISGGATATKRTNAAGCAVFDFIPSDTYSAVLNTAGYVTPAGLTSTSTSGTVTPGNVNSTPPFRYDRAARVTVSVVTKPTGAASPVAATTTSIVAGHPDLPVGSRMFAASPATGSIVATSLFPFPTPYAFYSGTCTAADPARWVTDYYTTNAGSLQVDPAGNYSLTVTEPALNVVVQTNGVARVGARVVIRPTDTGCTHVETPTSIAGGRTPEPGHPFGNYTVCAQFDFGSGMRRRTINVANTAAAGTLDQIVDVRPASNSIPPSQSGACP